MIRSTASLTSVKGRINADEAVALQRPMRLLIPGARENHSQPAKGPRREGSKSTLDVARIVAKRASLNDLVVPPWIQQFHPCTPGLLEAGGNRVVHGGESLLPAGATFRFNGPL